MMMRPVLYDCPDACPIRLSEDALGVKDQTGVCPGTNNNRTALVYAARDGSLRRRLRSMLYDTRWESLLYPDVYP